MSRRSSTAGSSWPMTLREARHRTPALQRRHPHEMEPPKPEGSSGSDLFLPHAASPVKSSHGGHLGLTDTPARHRHPPLGLLELGGLDSIGERTSDSIQRPFRL